MGQYICRVFENHVPQLLRGNLTKQHFLNAAVQNAVRYFWVIVNFHFNCYSLFVMKLLFVLKFLAFLMLLIFGDVWPFLVSIFHTTLILCLQLIT